MYRSLEEGLGYIFENRKLLENALTHSSYANENRERGLPDNERLEFLGDSILGFVVADYLYRRFPEKPEGELTRIRADLVCETNLAKAAGTIHLGDFLLLGHGEDHGGGRKRDSIVSDAMESVIAASYMDGGFEAAKGIIDRLILSDIPVGRPRNYDYKTALQELVQRKKDQSLHYALIAESGPDHDKHFTVEVLLNGSSVGQGTGSSKKRAEQAAEAACNARIAEFKEILGAAAYDVDVPALEYTVVRALRERGLHAAAAESCTGGMIAERLTNVPGSSEVFGYGFVTYAEAAKQKLLGVDAAVIEKYNVVSGPVAAAMAFGAARESGAELAVGITGLAGPGGALTGKPVGTVYLAGADTRTDTGYLMRLTLGGYQDRQIIRTRAALYALDMLRRMALGLDVPDSVRFTPETADRDLDI